MSLIQTFSINKDYVNKVRSNLHNERAAEKRRKQNEQLAKFKEQKAKLHEARLKVTFQQTFSPLVVDFRLNTITLVRRLLFFLLVTGSGW